MEGTDESVFHWYVPAFNLFSRAERYVGKPSGSERIMPLNSAGFTFGRQHQLALFASSTSNLIFPSCILL